MRHFQTAWPTVLAAVGCTVFLFTCSVANSAISDDIKLISSESSFSGDISDTPYCTADGERDFTDGDYYYQQKYGYIYAQIKQPLGSEVSEDVGTDADEDKDADTEDSKDAGDTEDSSDAADLDGNQEDSSIDGTVPTEYGEETDSYIYQYEEAGYPEEEDVDVDDSEAENAEADDTEPMDYYDSEQDDYENTTQGSQANGYGYTYALPEDMYGTSIDPKTNIIEVEELMKHSWDDGSRYNDDYYTGSPYTTEYPGEFENNKEHLALFTWDPAELLTLSDQETLRVLAMVGDRAPGVSRAILSDYLVSLAVEATDLANRFEEESGLAVPSLADDLGQTAAFLACFRLAERGELESDEALRLLQKSLLHRSDRWNNWIDKVTGNESNIYSTDEAAQSKAAATNPVLRAVVLTAADSLERIGCVINGLSRRMKNLY